MCTKMLVTSALNLHGPMRCGDIARLIDRSEASVYRSMIELIRDGKAASATCEVVANAKPPLRHCRKASLYCLRNDLDQCRKMAARITQETRSVADSWQRSHERQNAAISKRRRF